MLYSFFMSPAKKEERMCLTYVPPTRRALVFNNRYSAFTSVGGYFDLLKLHQWKKILVRRQCNMMQSYHQTM